MSNSEDLSKPIHEWDPNRPRVPLHETKDPDSAYLYCRHFQVWCNPTTGELGKPKDSKD
jgi:hypothetical protein